jgi:type IV pilus assembly protein PilE
MRKLSACGSRATAGFTLVELLVAIIVLAIIVSIAVPSYSNQVRKSHRTEAKTALLDLASREERFFSTNGAYTNDAGQLGYATSTNNTMFQYSVGSNYYQVSVCVGANIPTGCAAAQATNTAATYLLVAVPLGTQAKDTSCANYTLDNTGVQGNSGTQTSGCW